jgi:hypothetical protein
MLSITFSFILFAKKFAIDNEKLFSNIDCKVFKEDLKSNIENVNEEKFLESFKSTAGLEYGALKD